MTQHLERAIRGLLLVLALSLFPVNMEAFASSQTDQSTIVVLPLKGSQINPGIIATLDEVLMDGISRSRRYHRVFGQSDMAAMIELASKQEVLGCDTTACMAEIAGAMGADLVLTGHVSRLGDKMLLILKIIDPLKSDVVARARVIEDYDEAELIDLIEGGIKGIHRELDSSLKTSPEAVSDAALDVSRSTSDPTKLSGVSQTGLSDLPVGIEASAETSTYNTRAWIALGTAAACMAGGALSLLVLRGSKADIDKKYDLYQQAVGSGSEQSVLNDFEGAFNNYNNFTIAGWSLLGLGGVALVWSVYGFSFSSSAEPVALTVVPNHNGVRLSFYGSF